MDSNFSVSRPTALSWLDFAAFSFQSHQLF
jgi:hypothetical protein